eukprot:TRINITY_DN297_c2_g1_i3.p2 TRINITY_DN297_c2_g1~~TRINITY_DN297_c2_g1_i3.p2  ORF type:complete len:149 (+),score=18.45 TRINITY_DN297_c2_g1_i3:89-535(+)
MENYLNYNNNNNNNNINNNSTKRELNKTYSNRESSEDEEDLDINIYNDYDKHSNYVDENDWRRRKSNKRRSIFNTTNDYEESKFDVFRHPKLCEYINSIEEINKNNYSIVIKQLDCLEEDDASEYEKRMILNKITDKRLRRTLKIIKI